MVLQVFEAHPVKDYQENKIKNTKILLTKEKEYSKNIID